ncbi:hypothetical protein [Isoptericola variabilis]|uniref:Uncharacterized protein n=1 Tax=Isoptericola variabilis (strain 225) TaxID=743718 RepID=F6FPY1_ISOV2|nr:hypothetical protein [Isoptericola variabilis]AEG43770.1 hypothetical protein Isova_0987 [Isoptericola variabilis 225]TWH27452.1 hypothetical protein L600_000500001250 [Isoptericola variabilis J7]
MSVVWQQVATPDDVEAPLGDPPAPPRPGLVRRWLWAPALAAAVVLYVVRRSVEDPSAELELWLVLGMLAAVALTAVAALVRYRDDQTQAAAARGARALATDARATTGSVTVRERPVRGGRMLSGVLAYPGEDGTAEETWSLLVRDDDELAAPRAGDPVAVWWAPGSDVVVARYNRAWADEVRRRTR